MDCELIKLPSVFSLFTAFIFPAALVKVLFWRYNVFE